MKQNHLRGPRAALTGIFKIYFVQIMIPLAIIVCIKRYAQDQYHYFMCNVRK